MPTHADLIARLNVLEINLLPSPPSPTGAYTSQQTDLIRSYVLLAYAEIENFCEEIVLDAVNDSRRRASPGRCTPMISRLVTCYAVQKSEFSVLTDELMDAALQRFGGTLNANHGIKSANVLGMFLPIGINHSDFDPATLATMDSFGQDRGLIAHKSFRARRQIDPISEKNRVEAISQEVGKIAQLVSRLR